MHTWNTKSYDRLDGSSDRYSALMKFDNQSTADDFFKHYNEKPFSPFEEEVCLVPFIADVQYTNSAIEASNPPIGLTELPTCPVCFDVDMDMRSPETAWQGMDVADLPYVEDANSWFPLPTMEEMVWDQMCETEKACSDRLLSTSATLQHPIFSKVFGVGNVKGNMLVCIPNTYTPRSGSPSKILQQVPNLLDGVINATLRVRVSHTDGSGHEKVSYGTCFSVSPSMVLTAGHILDKDLVTEMKACEGVAVNASRFDTVAALEGTQSKVIRSCSKATDTNGLFISGADIACFKVQGDFESFLLPCSPTFLRTDTAVAVLSFPSIDRFLEIAKGELINSQDNATRIWDQYFPTVKPIYEETLKEHAKANGMRVAKAKATKSIVEVVCKKVKAELFGELYRTFSIAHTGSMVCSVGDILCRNKAALGTSCSTLAGSSGAAIIPLSRPTDFIAVQKGGCKGHDLNTTTTSDNKDMVDLYMSQVLHTLPAPDNKCWKMRDTDGFKHWMNLHKSKIPKVSAWLEAQHLQNSIFKKSCKRKALFK